MNRDAPNVTISIRKVGDVKATPVDLSDRLVAFSYDDNALLVDEASVSLDNSDLAFFDDPLFRLKNEIEVSWGYRGDMSEPRRCVIVEIQGGPLFTFKANGQAQWMDGERKTRKWEATSRSEVVKKIAGEYGFGTDAFIEDTKVILPQITQAGLSDAQFVKHLANKEGFEFFVSRGQLHFHRAKLDQRPVRTLIWSGKTNAQDPDSLFVTPPTYSEELKGKVGAMAHKGIDPMSKKKVEASSSNADHDGPTLGTVIEVFDQRSGRSQGMSTKMVAEDVAPTSAPTAEAAKRESDAKYRSNRDKLIRLKFAIVGDKDIGARDLIVVSGIGQRLSGKWYVVQANHRPVGGGAYVTTLECSRDAHFGYGDPKRDVKAKGALNQKEAAEDDALEAVEEHDQRTGALKGTAYRPKH